jgi:uncharacterized membrane protein YkoI
MLFSRIISAGFIAALVLGGATAALAETGHEMGEQQELNAVTNAKTSLSQAIAAAEQETGGKAVGSGIENQDGSVAYEVEIAKGTSLQKVLVDLDSGKVIKVTAAGGDEADEHEEGSEHESD